MYPESDIFLNFGSLIGKEMKIAIIGGGNIGGSIAGGLAAGDKVAAKDITVSDHNAQALDKIRKIDPQIGTTTDNREAARQADLVIVAVKPWLNEEVVSSFKDVLDFDRQMVASIVAGVDFENLRRIYDNGSGKSPVLFRVIPNTAISLRESVTFLASDGATPAQVAEVSGLFGELGQAIVVPEPMMAAGTSLASCGIAFALKYLDASIRGGVELGFTEEEARSIVMQTMRGALALLEKNGTMPQAEIDKVTTPGGLTLKGLDAMAESGFSESVRAGLQKSR